MEDVANQSHYTQGAYEPIEFIFDVFSECDGFIGFCAGNVVKYMARWGRKQNDSAGLDKACVYLDFIMAKKYGRLVRGDEARVDRLIDLFITCQGFNSKFGIATYALVYGNWSLCKRLLQSVSRTVAQSG